MMVDSQLDGGPVGLPLPFEEAIQLLLTQAQGIVSGLQLLNQQQLCGGRILTQFQLAPISILTSGHSA